MYRDGGGLTVRFWGTRGSLPSPGPDTARYGGNTSCVEVRAGEHLLIFDAGSGIRELGNRLLRDMPLEAHIFFTHYHWDHIMGFPFFGPIFVPGNEIHLYGEDRDGMGVQEILSGQMQAPYFPITMVDEARSNMTGHAVGPGSKVEIGDVTVEACRLNHPNEAIAYRVSHHGRAIVYATDIEHDPKQDKALIELSRGADALIYDSTYTDAEYAGHIGWGHSTWRAGVDIAKAAGVKQFVIFHHLPERTDREVASIERAARRVFAGAIAAREGLELTYPARSSGKNAEKSIRNGVDRLSRAKKKSTRRPAKKKAKSRKQKSR